MKQCIVCKSHSLTIFSLILQQFYLLKEMALIVSKYEYQIIML